MLESVFRHASHWVSCKNGFCNKDKMQQMKGINKTEEIKYATSETLLSRLHIHKGTSVCTICLLCFWTPDIFESHLFQQLLLCSLLIFPKSFWIFLFLKDLFSLSQKSFLQFFSPSIITCPSHIVESQCFGSEILQSLSLITARDPHGAPTVLLQQQRCVCCNIIYLTPFSSSFVVPQGYHFTSSETVLIR